MIRAIMGTINIDNVNNVSNVNNVNSSSTLYSPLIPTVVDQIAATEPETTFAAV